VSLTHDLRKLGVRLIWFKSERERLMDERDIDLEDDLTDHGDQDQFTILCDQFGTAIREVAALGVRASFEQKLNAWRAYNALGKYRDLLSQYREHRHNPLFRTLDPDNMVGEGHHAIWEAMCHGRDGERFRDDVQHVLNLPEVVLLAGYDLLHPDSRLYWTPDERRRFYDESIDTGD
jgi:hypothetical protein